MMLKNGSNILDRVFITFKIVYVNYIYLPDIGDLTAEFSCSNNYLDMTFLIAIETIKKCIEKFAVLGSWQGFFR